MENKFNVEICLATNIPCSHCQPICDHRYSCDKCNVKTCGANFDGWCRNPYLMCWVRKEIPEYAEAYKERNKVINHAFIGEIERRNKMGKYIPQLGDVIMDNGIPMIVVTIKNHERIGDCSYDREYFICEEEYICKCGCLSCMDEMKQHGRWVRIEGVEFPNIEQAEGYAPYEITPIESYKFRQKKAKTIITYE